MEGQSGERSNKADDGQWEIIWTEEELRREGMHIGNRGQKERWRCREDWKEGNCGGRGEVEGEKGYRCSGGR